MKVDPISESYTIDLVVTAAGARRGGRAGRASSVGGRRVVLHAGMRSGYMYTVATRARKRALLLCAGLEGSRTGGVAYDLESKETIVTKGAAMSAGAARSYAVFSIVAAVLTIGLKVGPIC